ncbi:MAG: RNase P subunit p30 family protein [Nanoarchaeota archaeon]
MENYTTVSEEDFQKARNAIKKARETASSKKIIFSAFNDDLNRKILEKEKIDILLIKLGGRKDRIKQRNSGFNQVLAKLAHKKEVAIGIDLDEILGSDKKEKTRILARLMQNISICKKNNLNMVFLNENHTKNMYDLRALGLVLGMPTSMTKNL